MQQQGHLRIYGCGGFGINIASHFETAAGVQEPGHSIPLLAYIDTSRSNLKAGLNPEHVYILDDVDGSGKVRSENHLEIGKIIKPVLQQHKPADFNVVVFSASGGSGSVVGPLIMAELLERGLPAVAVVVGSDESMITATNTLKTLKSLEAIAAKTGLPVVINYDHNESSIKRSAIDASCRHVIASISMLCSRQNAELDSKDIANWVQFNKSTSVKPRLALFEVYNTNEEAEQIVEPVAIASLYRSPDAEQIKSVPEYSCAGYPSAGLEKVDLAHFVILVDGVPVIAKRMQHRVNELEQTRKARVEHDSLVGAGDIVEGSGLVL